MRLRHLARFGSKTYQLYRVSAVVAVKSFVNIFEVLVGDVRIDLRSRDTAVPEHALHAANVGAIHEQVGGETVAHRVRADMLGDAG